MNYSLINKIFAAVVFLISVIVLFMTVQPSVSFWDAGEFIAASYYLQVPHPPGTPFFLLVGRIFSMIPFVENVGLRVNTISVLTSALSILFLYLIIVKVIYNYRGRIFKNSLDAFATFFAAAIGALSFSFSDTFWFNGVEAEVYAFSTFLFAAVVWLMMRWHERADSPDNEKYLLMIFYLIGLSTGVHLMSVLAIVPVVMVVIFRKYLTDEAALKTSGYIFLGHAAVVLLIAFIMWGSQTSTNPPSPDEYAAYDSRFKLIIGGISILIMAVFWKKLFQRNSFYVPLIIGGVALFAVYPGIVKYVTQIIAALVGDNTMMGVVVFLLMIGALAYGVKYSINKNKPTLHLVFMSAIFAFIGFTTFAMVIIRANQNPPMNENEPDKFTELVSYLNREQYGDFPTFKRRFATEPHQRIVYTGYRSDLDFFWSYQMNHMMTRYLLWNYAGRESWVQDSGANMAPFNGIGNAFGKIFGVNFAGTARDSLYGIPFLLGLLGIYFHFRKDWKMASVFMVMFILMGYLTAFYQNQQQPQPRERDYFYVGAFFVYSLWIGIAIRGLISLAQNHIRNITYSNAAVVGIIVFGIVLVPVNMLRANYYTHDRSNNWIPWDYSYNLLQSCAPNAVLFTNGDNDTFPLWYLQDVEGVRRDVKVANLSLLNTNWYIRQLKNNDPYNVGTVNIRFTDTQIEQLRPVQWEPRDVTIPASSEALRAANSDLLQTYSTEPTEIMQQGSITWRMNNTLTFGEIKAVRVQDLMVKEIVEANNWERPIYFAITCSDDSKIGLQDYLKLEGMALRIVPERRQPNQEFLNVEILEAQLQENPGYSETYQPGFKFRGLNDPSVFLDDNHRRMTINYRSAFLRLALYYIQNGNNPLAIRALDNMETVMPRDVTGLEPAFLFEIGNIYHSAGAYEQYEEIAREVEVYALQRLEEDPTNVSGYNSPYRLLIGTYENLGEYRKLSNVWHKLSEMYPDDPNVRANVVHYQQLAAEQDKVKIDTVPVPRDTNP
jgi:tetratricopeptide (TPR) repeat protein